MMIELHVSEEDDDIDEDVATRSREGDNWVGKLVGRTKRWVWAYGQVMCEDMQQPCPLFCRLRQLLIKQSPSPPLDILNACVLSLTLKIICTHYVR